MRVTKIVSGFVSWRWMPFCALVAGTLLCVGVIVLIVPKSLDKPLPRTHLLTPVPGPQSDTLTSTAPGSPPLAAPAALLPAPAEPPPTRTVQPPEPGAGLLRSLSAPVTAPGLAPSRRSVLGEPPPAALPSPSPVHEPPHGIVSHSVQNGLRMVRPLFMAPTPEKAQPAEPGNHGGAGANSSARRHTE